jgi:hypothetical protein
VRTGDRGHDVVRDLGQQLLGPVDDAMTGAIDLEPNRRPDLGPVEKGVQQLEQLARRRARIAQRPVQLGAKAAARHLELPADVIGVTDRLAPAQREPKPQQAHGRGIAVGAGQGDMVEGHPPVPGGEPGQTGYLEPVRNVEFGLDLAQSPRWRPFSAH